MRPPPIETWPEWARYAAEELSGSWYLYENKPRWNELCGEWQTEGKRQIVPRITVAAKDSLVVRP